MKVVILDDLDTSPPTEKQLQMVRHWYERLEKIFPHGEMQIYTVYGPPAVHLLTLLRENR